MSIQFLQRWYLTSLIISLSFLLLSCSSQEEHYQGYVEGENIYLTSSENGILKELLVQRGEKVKAGELLFKLDPFPQILEIRQNQANYVQGERLLQDLIRPKRPQEIEALEASVKQVNAQKTLAELRLKRYEELYKKHIVPKDTLDSSLERFKELKYLQENSQAKLDLAREGARVDQIAAQRAKVSGLMAQENIAKWQLQQKNVAAPADGMIVDTYYRVGEYVSNQRAVLSLLTPHNTHIEFFVPATTLAWLNVGDVISYLCAGCAKTNMAKISYISPEAEYAPPLVYSRENDAKLVFRVKAHINDPSQLKPGQPVTVTLRQERRHGS